MKPTVTGRFLFLTKDVFMSIQVLSFNCVLKNRAGKVISSTYNREVLNISGAGDTLVGLVKNLETLKTGEKRTVSLTADQAYGLYDPKKIILYPRKKLPKDLTVGEAITIIGKDGAHREYKIVQFFDDLVRLDGNHPLAGQDLIFEIEMIESRDATADELEESLNPFSVQRLH